MIPNPGSAACCSEANNQEMGWWKEKAVYSRVGTFKKMVDSHSKDLNVTQTGVSVRREEEEKKAE